MAVGFNKSNKKNSSKPRPSRYSSYLSKHVRFIADMIQEVLVSGAPKNSSRCLRTSLCSSSSRRGWAHTCMPRRNRRK